jgi:UDP-glucose 4-epimerase
MTDDGPKSVVVTGGAGFIGSALVSCLAEAGHKVAVVDNLVNGKKKNLDGPGRKSVHLVIGDIRDADCMRPLLAECDLLFNLACLGVRHSLHAPIENHDVNATGTLHLLKLAREAGVKRFVHVSTSEVYGTARHVPMSEDHPIFPSTVYGASKLAGECYARAFHETYGFPVVVLRPFNCFGPNCHHEGDSGEVIPRFMLRSMAGRPMIIFGDGEQTRDFSYVAETARAISLAGFRESAVGRTINIGGGREISINELARRVAAAVPGSTGAVIHEKPRPADVLRLYADANVAKDVLGYVPTASLEEGLIRLREWYSSREESPEQMLEREQVRNWEEPPEQKREK